MLDPPFCVDDLRLVATPDSGRAYSDRIAGGAEDMTTQNGGSRSASGQGLSGRRAAVRSIEPLLDIDGVATALGTTVRHVRRLVFERRIPYIKVGALLRFDPAAIGSWLEEHTVSTLTSPERGTW